MASLMPSRVLCVWRTWYIELTMEACATIVTKARAMLPSSHALFITYCQLYEFYQVVLCFPHILYLEIYHLKAFVSNVNIFKNCVRNICSRFWVWTIFFGHNCSFAFPHSHFFRYPSFFLRFANFKLIFKFLLSNSIFPFFFEIILSKLLSIQT